GSCFRCPRRGGSRDYGHPARCFQFRANTASGTARRLRCSSPWDKKSQEVIVMLLKTATSLAFAATCLTALATVPAQAQMPGSALTYAAPQTIQGDMPSPSALTTEVITNGPQGSPPANWSARRNVIESRQYDRLLETNRGFREARIRKECGPITDQE